MRRTACTRVWTTFGGFALIAMSSAAIAKDGPETTSQAAQAPYSSASTELGTLLHDPAALAVLRKDIPDFLGGPETMEQTWAMTLREMQVYLRAYKAGVLTDEKLAKVDADLAKIPR